MKFKERFIQQRRDFAELMKHYPFTTETLAGEEWKDIEGTDGKYQISNYGRVKSFQWGKPKIITPRLDLDGYLSCELSIQPMKRRIFGIHRLVAKHFIPNTESKPQINHKDGIRWNSCISNLEWVTRSENVRHAFDTKMHTVLLGEDNPQAKLTNEQALYIRENPDDLTGRELAKKFGVGTTTISCIQRGEKYCYVGGEYRAEHGLRKLPEKVRKQIRAEYIYGSKEFGSTALAKKYGVSKKTILLIIREMN